MESTIDYTLAERGSRYGEFSEQAFLSQELEKTMRLGRNWPKLPDDMREALKIVQHKISRILNGDPYYLDSWIDIEGYTRLISRRIEANGYENTWTSKNTSNQNHP